MKTVIRAGLFLSAIFVVSCVAIAPAWGITTFPNQGNYQASGTWGDALWSWRMQIAPAYQPYFASLSLPNYDMTSGILSSGLLYDSNGVMIGSSNPFVGTAGPTGVAVGTANLMVKDSALTAPAGWNDTGGRKVYNSVVSTNATDTGPGYALRFGSAAADQPATVGENQSLSGNQNANNDFPAQSFFDIFADLDVPNVGTFYNTAPFITSYAMPNNGVVTPAPNSSGPYYVQLFQNTSITTAAVYARKDGTAGVWSAGDNIGTAQLVPYGGVAQVPEPVSTSLAAIAACGLMLRPSAARRPLHFVET
jgi:hypothetical protein